MSTPTPALDFCRKVQTWQETDANKTAGLTMIMPQHEEDTLTAILAEADHAGNLNWSELRARRWLVGYREMENEQRILTAEQRAELGAVVDQVAAEERLTGSRTTRWQPTRREPSIARFAVTLLAVIIAVAAALAGIKALAGSSQGSPPPAGPAAAAPQQPAQGPLTDLQQFRADWNVPSAASASAGEDQVHLVLLQDGLYYPAPWIILPGDPGWVTDTTGRVTATEQGGMVAVTDSDGTTWTVFTGRPFVLASNPQVVFRVLHDATIQSMPQPHAIRVRTRA